MKRKGGAPHATMRFMPLADIFIGAIACLLILIVVARQAKEATTRIPQADLVLSCAKAEGAPRGKFSVAVVSPGPGKDRGAGPVLLDGQKLARFLRGLQTPGRLTSRILLVAQTGNDEGRCVRAMRKMVRGLNRDYENPDSKNRPRSYLLFDLAYSAGNEGAAHTKRPAMQ